ncbi:MAG: hypothetical protein JRN67_05200 [Nitrososphaerota archaeon]|nr:hypothetical protein [Nitrososphaerota archaeon]
MSLIPFLGFDSYSNRCLSGEDIRYLASVKHIGYSFVLVGPCCIELRPTRTLISDVRLRRDKVTDQSYLPYLGQLRGPLHIYDPNTSEELPRIRLFVPESLSFAEQREWFSCFARRALIVNVFSEQTKSPISATVTLDYTSFEAPNGSARFYGLPTKLPVTVTIRVESPGYNVEIEQITIPPFVHNIYLEKTVEQHYQLYFYIVSMNYMNEEYFEISMIISSKDTIKRNEREDIAIDLARVLMSKYMEIDEHPDRAKFIEKSEFKLGEMEDQLDEKFKTLVTPTESQILDARYDKVRAAYEVPWYEVFRLGGSSTINFRASGIKHIGKFSREIQQAQNR